jgi:hypothetical protein|tara:strand:+ start:1737 stop:2000 length:264 start_codon:yes stop_codon:yes gene_type:complete
MRTYNLVGSNGSKNYYLFQVLSTGRLNPLLANESLVPVRNTLGVLRTDYSTAPTIISDVSEIIRICVPDAKPVTKRDLKQAQKALGL